MVDRKVGVFLYQSTRFTRTCDVLVPEDIRDFGYCFILEMKVGDILLKRIVRTVDMLTSSLKVYKIRPGTKEEYQRCMDL